MSESIKSIRLRGKPNKEKLEALRHIQSAYTDGVNAFIDMLWDEESLFGDIFRCRSSSSIMRDYEKKNRIAELGSAMSQSAMDEATEKLAEVFARARKEMPRFLSKDDDEYFFVVSIAMFTACLANNSYSEVRETMSNLFEKAKKKNGVNDPTCRFYQECLDALSKFGEKKTLEVMDKVKYWFVRTKNDRNIPHVAMAWVRADSRVQNFGKSDNIVAPYVAEITTEVGGERTVVPLITSPDSLRRLSQYGVASTIMYSVKPNGVLLVNVAVKKKATNKSKKDLFVGADAGITDVLVGSDSKFYGSLLPAQKFYDEVVLVHLARLQALQNLMRKTRITLRNTTDEAEKNKLRLKICHLNTMIQQNRVVGRSLNRYDAIVDKEIADVVNAFVADRLADLATTVIEKLDIRVFGRGKKANRRDSMWARGKLNKRLTEALEWHGLSVIEVEPSYTSQICPICGHLERANRNGKVFKCLHCGHEDDADHNASLNIVERVTNKELKALLARPATLKQRQDAIRRYYAEKEKAYDASHTLNTTASTA